MGPDHAITLKVVKMILKSILALMSSQWRAAKTGVMWDRRLVLVRILAAVFCTSWSLESEELLRVV